MKVPNSAPTGASRVELDGLNPPDHNENGHVRDGGLRALILDEENRFGEAIGSLVQRGITVVGIAKSTEQTFTVLNQGLPDIVLRCMWARDMPRASTNRDGSSTSSGVNGPDPVAAKPALDKSHAAGDRHGERAVAAMAALTRREQQILELLIEGASNKDMARRLSIRSNTVRTHVQNVLTKLSVHTRLGAATLAMRYGAMRPNEVA